MYFLHFYQIKEDGKNFPFLLKYKSKILTKEEFDNLKSPISLKYKEIGYTVIFLNINLII